MRNPIIKALTIIINSLILFFLFQHSEGISQPVICLISGFCIFLIICAVIIKSPDKIAETRVEKRLKKRGH